MSAIHRAVRPITPVPTLPEGECRDCGLFGAVYNQSGLRYCPDCLAERAYPYLLKDNNGWFSPRSDAARLERSMRRRTTHAAA